MILPKGTLFIITEGDYSDYQLITLCKTRADLDILALREEYLTQFPDEREQYKFHTNHFIKWLTVDKKYVKEIDYWECHIASYGNAGFDLSKSNE